MPGELTREPGRDRLGALCWRIGGRFFHAWRRGDSGHRSRELGGCGSCRGDRIHGACPSFTEGPADLTPRFVPPCISVTRCCDRSPQTVPVRGLGFGVPQPPVASPWRTPQEFDRSVSCGVFGYRSRASRPRVFDVGHRSRRTGWRSDVRAKLPAQCRSVIHEPWLERRIRRPRRR